MADKKTFVVRKQSTTIKIIIGLSSEVIGSIDEKLEEMQWIGKLEVIDD